MLIQAKAAETVGRQQRAGTRRAAQRGQGGQAGRGQHQADQRPGRGHTPLRPGAGYSARPWAMPPKKPTVASAVAPVPAGHDRVPELMCDHARQDPMTSTAAVAAR